MWFADELESSIESKYEKKLCEILEVPKEFIPEIKKTLVEKNMNLERFLELWEFCNEFEEETYLDVYKKLFRDISCINPIINMSCLIFWKLFDHIVENQHYLKLNSKKYDENSKTYIYTNLYQGKNGYSNLTSYFSVYKCFVEMAFRNNRCNIDIQLYDYFERELCSLESTLRYPFFFKKTYFRYLRKKLKNHSTVIGKLILYYYKINEERYKPGGIGYYVSENSWNINFSMKKLT